MEDNRPGQKSRYCFDCVTSEGAEPKMYLCNWSLQTQVKQIVVERLTDWIKEACRIFALETELLFCLELLLLIGQKESSSETR